MHGSQTPREGARILTLPRELLEMIAGLSTSTLALMQTCKALKNALDTPATWKRLLDELDRICCLDFPIEPPDLPVDAYAPLIIMGTAWSGGALRVRVFAASWPLTDNDPYWPADVRIELDDVYFRELGWQEHDSSYSWEEPDAEFVELDWETQCKGRLRYARGALLRQHFVCRECHGRRWCGGLSDRFRMPCPCCVGADVAKQVTYMAEVGDYAGIDALWEELERDHDLWPY